MRARVHFNKRGKSGFVWTIHTRRKCIPAKKVVILGNAVTEFKPDEKANPRAFIMVEARKIIVIDGIVTLIGEERIR